MVIGKKTFINSLKEVKRPFLAQILEKIWELPLYEYANSLWEKSDFFSPMEFELIEAFETEFLRIGVNINEVKSLSSKLEKTRVVQTATHLTATEGPTFLALHHLALLRMPPQETYFVGTYSGVSFANSAWSGCLNYSNRFDLEDLISSQFHGLVDLKRSNEDRSRDSLEKRISLIPGKMRDSRVFKSKIPEKLINLLDNFTDPIRKVAPPAKIGNDFSIWANQFCANQLRYIIKDKSILYFDINEVIRSYLLKVLKNSAHPIHCLFFNEKIRKHVFNIFSPKIPLFTVEVSLDNKIRHQSVFLGKGELKGQNYNLELSLENLLQELEKGILCPGLFLMFTSLSFLNGFNCFGSFEQVEYLSEFRERWLKTNLLDQDVVRLAKISSLTSGRCIDEFGNAVYPLDLLMGFEWNFPENINFGDLMTPLLPRMGVKI